MANQTYAPVEGEKKKTVVTVGFLDHQLKFLDEEAKRQQRSRASLIRILVEDAIKRKK